MSDVVIIGTGMAGFGAATRLAREGIRPVALDQAEFYGGHTASFRDERGFLFDIGPHISFSKDERIQQLFASYVDQKYNALQVKLNNYWQGRWITHPVQLHLNALPHDLIIEIINDFVAAERVANPVINNYEDWLVASFGRRFAEVFPLRYGHKYHTTEAKNMSTEWLGPRFYRPSLSELLRGALAPWEPQLHYITNFRYPQEGGFISYLRELPRVADIQLSQRVVEVDPKRRTLRMSDGAVRDYGKLISSVPLTDLLPMVKGAPRDVVAASQRLACTTCVLVNVAVKRTELSSTQMSYFYDSDISFARISFPHMLAASNVPPGHGSIQCEVYFSKKYKPLDVPEQMLVDRAVADLRKCGVLKAEEPIISARARLIPYANIIFDLERAAAVQTVHGYLDDVGIHYCGRYGDWGYLWTDESFISGERAAEKSLSAVSTP